ncbi:hypothetical protein RRG08_007000 [Elysia crispata]|uniref:Uncharacterized protein n=1 Tax=Elysia crispata TaxID=231223 RepID=A0AAE1BC94_9GAST|nr:hypothetical protein RRG08_007000 [Elysia crispata]
MIEKNRSLRQLETRKREEKYGDRKKRQKREEAGNREEIRHPCQSFRDSRSDDGIDTEEFRMGKEKHVEKMDYVSTKPRMEKDTKSLNQVKRSPVPRRACTSPGSLHLAGKDDNRAKLTTRGGNPDLMRILMLRQGTFRAGI